MTSAATPTFSNPLVATPATVAKTRKATASGPEGLDRINREFAANNPNHRITIEKVLFTELFFDDRIQRPEQTPLINGIVRDGFDPNAVGTLTLSARYEDGRRKLYCIDGRQRSASGLRVGYDQPVQAVVHEGLSLPEEARLFLKLNRRRGVNAWDTANTMRTAGDPAALAVWKILEEERIPRGGPKGFNAVAMAARVANRTKGLDHFRWALQMVRDIYDTHGEGGCYDHRVVEAFVILHAHYGAVIDDRSLVLKLSKVGGGTAGLIGHGHTIQKVHRSLIATAIANAIIHTYNAGRHADAKRTTKLDFIGVGAREAATTPTA